MEILSSLYFDDISSMKNSSYEPNKKDGKNNSKEARKNCSGVVFDFFLSR